MKIDFSLQEEQVKHEADDGSTLRALKRVQNHRELKCTLTVKPRDNLQFQFILEL